MHRYATKAYAMLLLCTILMLFPYLTTRHALAGPANPDPINIQQPNGKVFSARIFGDESQGWIETLDGYTVIKNPATGYWEYATGISEEAITLSVIAVDPLQPPPPKIPKHLRPKRDKSHDDKFGLQGGRRATINGVHLTNWDPQPASGARRLLIILVNFNNRTLNTTAANWSTTVFSTTPGVKSVANFYKDNSFGQMSINPVPNTQAGAPAGVVTVTIADNHPDYADNYTKATETPWLNHALDQAKTVVDFAALDTNNNGTIENSEALIYFIPAGYDASGTSKTPNVWAHAWSGNEVSVSGKTVARWAMNGELNDNDRQHPMGVIAHELGHQMCSLPDLYDISYKNDGLGCYSLMSFGSWGRAATDQDNGTTPVSMDAWCRQFVGWASPRQPAGSGPLSFGPPLDSTTAPLKMINSGLSTTDYFLVENRYPKGWDLGLERWLGQNWGGGLLIQHIDITIGSQANNDINEYNPGGHQGVIVMEASTANGSTLTVPPGARGDVTHLFYDPNNKNFLDYTTPNSKLWDGTSTKLGICDCSTRSETMTATYVNCDTAKLTACLFDDHNANGTLQAGEDGTFVGWKVDWSGAGKSGTATITSLNCVDLFDDLPPCKFTVTLKVSDIGGKFDDPTGNNKRWQLTTPKTVTVDTSCDTPGTVRFGVVQLGKIAAYKFDDTNMNGAQEGSEANIAGWPFKLTGNAINGTPLNLTGNTDAAGEYVFTDLLPSDPAGYTVRENLTWESVQPCATNPYVVNRASHAGKRWQATTPIEITTVLAEGAEVSGKYGNVCLGSIAACKYNDHNMSGSKQAVAESFTDTNGNGKWDTAELYADVNNNGNWDPAEPYTDKNGNGRYDSGEPFVDVNGNTCWDNAEPLRDDNGNGVWDPAEPFVDSFANGTWDAAEEGLANWPLAVCGTDAAGRCIGPITATTDGSGCATILDLPPGDYKVYEDVEWCGSKIDWCNGGTAPAVDKLKTTVDGLRWLATTEVMKPFTYDECSTLPNFEFGNVVLGSIFGKLNLKSCPNDPPTPLDGWTVCLTTAKVEQTVTFTTLPLPATNPDCTPLAGNCAITAPDGSFQFGELVPGLYQISAVIPPGYVPVGDVIDLTVPFRLSGQDVEKDLAVRDTSAICSVYQAVPGSSEGLMPCLGYRTLDVDPITAAPGILSFDPGSKWENFVRAYRAGKPYCLKDVQLDKVHPGGRQCVDVFGPGRINQHGTPNVRTWWPLMYEPYGTTWTVTILYTTLNSVMLPGETSPSVVHQDKWKWNVVVSLDSLDSLLDLFHELPHGTSEAPLISDETAYSRLKGLIMLAKGATSNPTELSAILSQIELATADYCISEPPRFPFPSGAGRGLGIANTAENPACCKILSDLDYLLLQFASP